MNKTFSYLVIIMIAVCIVSSCSKSTNGGGFSVDCNTVSNKAFAADVNPIIQSSCTPSGCHNTGSGNGPGPLTNYTEVFNARSSIESAVSSGRMPKNSSLSTSQKNSIICWIQSGAPNN
ncbi:MAG: hypothetical protein ACRDEB_04215 [Chitinophagaceae bacterium]